MTNRASGLTLIEVLIATTLTLMLMLALAQGFKTLSQSVSEGRTKLGLSDQLRGITMTLRSDLDRCTVPRNPGQPYPGPGYFKYYDGPIWDSTALQVSLASGQALLGSKWGDIDDVLMFTAKAEDGQVFRGTVPRAVLIISQLNRFDKERKYPNSSLTEVDNFISGIDWAAAWTTEVSIESDLAEIAWFMMPLAEGNRLPVATPPLGAFIEPTVSQTVVDVSPLDGMPDKIALCRRVLLIRPDIDLSPNPSDSTYRTLIATGLTHALAPRAIFTAGNPASYRTAMHQFFQRCDLSLKLKNWEQVSGGFFLSAESNSLEDLQLPENRFAHYCHPVPASNGPPVNTATLPVLALTDETGVSAFGADTAAAYRLATDPFYQISLGNSNVVNRGFILPCFMRSRFDGTPILSEIVATNVIAFDAKVFDSTAKQLAHPGPDTTFGDITTPIAGYPGTDDATVSPSDPGFAERLSISGATTPTIFGQGAYVDNGWGWRLHTNPLIAAMPIGVRATNKDFFRGNASGISDITASLVADPALFGGGAAYVIPNYFNVYQPVYDTYTDYYDFDGEKLDIVAGQRFYRDGLRRYGVGVASGALDDLYDGIRNSSLFGDAVPPAPFDIPSVKVTVRVQDGTAGMLQQMSVIHSFPAP
ncbi:hypothetical protein SH501x_000084 [Pirellulaceae bacterium SH501]